MWPAVGDALKDKQLYEFRRISQISCHSVNYRGFEITQIIGPCHFICVPLRPVKILATSTITELPNHRPLNTLKCYMNEPRDSIASKNPYNSLVHKLPSP